MKRFLALLLILVTLISIFPMAFADVKPSIPAEKPSDTKPNDEPAEEDVMLPHDLNRLISMYVNQDEYSSPMPLLECDNTEGSSKFYLTYRMDDITRFLLSPTIREQHKTPKTWETDVLMEFRIDDGEWMSSEDWQPCFAEVITFVWNYHEPITESVRACCLDFSKYDATLDEDGVFKDVLTKTDNGYVFDLSKHSIAIRVYANIYYSKGAVRLPYSQPIVLTDTDDNDNWEAPIIQDLYYNQEDNNLSMQPILSSPVAEAIAKGNSVDLMVKYRVNNDEEVSVTMPMDNRVFYFIDLEKPCTVSDEILVSVAYFNNDTGMMTEWTEHKAKFTPTGGLITPDEDWFDEGGKPVTPTPPTQSEPHQECGICKSCPTQPLGICLWVFIGIIVCALVATGCGISMIVDAKTAKSKSKTTAKPNKRK